MDSALRITAVDPDPRRPDAVRVEIDGARFGAVPRELRNKFMKIISLAAEVV